MKLKVCGMTDIAQIEELDEMGVAFAGMIFYAKSPRYVAKHGLSGSAVKKAKLKLVKVGVFVDAPYDEIVKAIHEFGLDMVQLHGHETPFECAKISDYIHLIKAFRFAENDHVEWMIKDYYNDADMFMFDTGVPVTKTKREDTTLYGGTGRKFNWNRLKGLNINKPFFLSGGIEPTDAQVVKNFMKDPVAKDLFVVDINSRFESSPGVKNMGEVRKFFEELQPE
ncbi:MAG TPA: phosphoribosylanthranilate isomerase [Chitinophagaceae bacterium]|nr:phosphoribosylanthranilate isomerase [Chitinophagaceae bacterium]